MDTGEFIFKFSRKPENDLKYMKNKQNNPIKASLLGFNSNFINEKFLSKYTQFKKDDQSAEKEINTKIFRKERRFKQ